MATADYSARVVCAGRFTLTLPAGFQLRTSEFEFDNVAIETEAISSSADDSWRTRVDLLGAKELPPGRTAVVIHEKMLGNRLRGAYYYGDPLVPESVSLTALLETESQFLWLDVESMEGNEALMAEVVHDIANAFQPVREGERPPNPDWFCLIGGAIVRPMQTMERAVMHFEDPDSGFELDIEQATISEPEARGLLERVASLLAVLGESETDEKVEEIRMQKRDVAGMRGEEAILRETDGESALSFNWESAGQPDTAIKPEFRIELSAPDKVKPTTKLWDALLDSVRLHGS